jgi:hypothetical protein
MVIALRITGFLDLVHGLEIREYDRGDPLR